LPVGLLVMRWDERIGTEILIKHPEEIILTTKTLMQIYSTHEYTGEPGMISLMVANLNITSYFTGPERNLYILLLLMLDEDPDLYESGLVDVSHVILQNYEDDSFIQMIPSLYQYLSVFPSLNEEQHLAMTYQNEIKRNIINRLREEGVVSKSELMVWLKEVYDIGSIDIDSVLTELIRKEIVKEASVKGMPSELIFLTKDLLMIRRPPINLLRNLSENELSSQLIKDYQSAVKNFFHNYHPSEEDNLKIINALVNPQVYETLRLLRIKIVTREELQKLKKKGVEDTAGVLKALYDCQLIKVFQGKNGKEHYALISDFYLGFMFPKYLLNIIKKEYENKSKANPVLIECLDVLETSYLNLKSKKKIKNVKSDY
jgi:hypothetical protein